MSPSTQLKQQPVLKQQRSRDRRAALLEHGALLFNRRDLDELSVAEITATLGYSTGSFYSYFPDKSAYFVAVQEWIIEQQSDKVACTFEGAAMVNRSLVERLALTVDFVLAYFKQHTGLIRSALRYERRIPDGWAPNRATTRRIVSGACKGLEKTEREHLEIALQMAFGMLINAVLHNPGPLHLKDPALKDKIIAALHPYLLTCREPTANHL